ncbi:hypothetical protein ACE10X_22365 [Bradyrhizobium sp. Pha-3]|uniref:hypothetical protein n=1 Tax=Bradyrhizobium sp. Pha-3 TaxID=208375 RepID=UPI0035D42D6E
MPIEYFPSSTIRALSGDLGIPSSMEDWERMANAASATAKTPAERATFARIAQTARNISAGALEPEAQAAFARVTQAFQELDAATSARTAELQGSLDRNVQALVPSAAPVNTSFSLVRGRLPDWVQAHLERIDDDLDEVRAQRHRLTEELQALIQERGDVVQKIRINTDEAQASRYGITVLMPEGHPGLVKLQADQAKLDGQIAKVNEKLDASKPRFEALDKLQERCRIYARHLLQQALEFIPHEGKQGKTVADLKKAIVDIRQEIAELFADLRELRDRPRPSADVKASARKLVDTTAKAPNVAQAIDHGDPITWPVAGIQTEIIRDDGRSMMVEGRAAAAFGRTTDALGFLLWAFKEPIIAALDQEIDRYADDANAITDADRALGEAELLAKILLLEREEEQLIRLAKERELPIHRRGDADPRVVLGLASSLPAMVEF